MDFQLPKQFKMIASLVLGFTLVTFIADIYLSTSFTPTEQIKQLISRCADTWKAGFGVFLGLIGGTAFSDSHQPADTKV